MEIIRGLEFVSRVMSGVRRRRGMPMVLHFRALQSIVHHLIEEWSISSIVADELQGIVQFISGITI
jgi:hypothetical protein